MVQFRLCAVLHAIKKNKNNEYVYHLFNELRGTSLVPKGNL